VPVAPGLVACPRGAAQIGKNAFQVRHHRLDALAFRPHRQQFLFEVEIERQRAREIKGKRALLGRRKILHGSSQRQNLEMRSNCPSLVFWSGSARLVSYEQYFRLQKGTLPVEFEHFKALAAFCNHIESSIGILLGDTNDFSGAPNFRDALFQCAHDAERRIVCPTLTNHLFVSRLENVQGQGSARKQYDVEREQGKQGQGISTSDAGTERAFRLYDIEAATHLDLPRGGEYNPSMELVGKVVVVTGASMGIGEAIAKVFAEEGASVVLLSRDAARAEAARVRIGCPERTAALSCDVRNSEEIDRVLALTLHHFKRADVWINNAGHGLLDSVAQTDMQACHDLFDTNFFGAMSAMQAVIPVMRQQGGGAIINISSVAGHIPLPFHASYSATKFALNAIGKAAGVELKKDGIHVLTVCPGYVRTAFSENAVRGSELKKVRPASVRGITAERVARATLRGYLKQKREVIVPWPMHVPVKLYQLFPAVVEWAMARMAK
jgi:short-subunit dehydrogenase